MNGHRTLAISGSLRTGSHNTALLLSALNAKIDLVGAAAR
ncbi:hypothetical protein ACRB68_53270 [Actinomadura sp. RB68]|uniref:Uncharacterized protein n=1 Tax=Actinomadura macrotermitis TaxID=2585200 RepID=A0A7K0C1A6_9ACTN|nr:hypothetical protein [Actinomadura macrotermitis]